MTSSSIAAVRNTLGASFDPAPAAQVLVQAWRDRVQIASLPESVRPGTLAEGFDVQDAVTAATGEEMVGWKLGVGSANAKRAAGIDRPLVGQLFASGIHANGGAVKLPAATPFTVEFEVAFYLSKDISPDTEVNDIRNIIASTLVTFELVHSRFVDRKSVGLPSFIGDSVGFGALVVGDAFDPAQYEALVQDAVVSVDGEERARGLTGDDIADPWDTLASLVEHAKTRGYTLKKGQIVSTGSVSKPFDVSKRGVQVQARYLGKELSVRVE